MKSREEDNSDSQQVSRERGSAWRAWISHLRVTSMARRYPPRLVWGAFVLINGFITIALLASVAAVSGTPFVFPSLGPTAILLFLQPLHPASSPRHALCGHAIGIACGYGALWVTGLTGLTNEPRVGMEGLEAERVVAAALSLAGTGTVMVLLNVSHPPAGATTLIIALGIIIRPYHLLVIEAAVAVLVLQALVINRLAGVPYPIWSVPRPARENDR